METDYEIMTKEKYKIAWGVDLKKSYVVIKRHMKNGEEIYTPQKTFNDRYEAEMYILDKNIEV